MILDTGRFLPARALAHVGWKPLDLQGSFSCRRGNRAARMAGGDTGLARNSFLIYPESSIFTLWNPPQEGSHWRHSTGQVQHLFVSSNVIFTPSTGQFEAKLG